MWIWWTLWWQCDKRGIWMQTWYLSFLPTWTFQGLKMENAVTSNWSPALHAFWANSFPFWSTIFVLYRSEWKCQFRTYVGVREDINRKTTFSFGLCPNHLKPPLTPILATWSSFLDVKNDILRVGPKLFWMMIMLVSIDNYDHNLGNFDDNYDKNDY